MGQGWLRRLGGHLMVHRADFFLAFGAAVVGTVAAVFVPLVERHVVDEVVAGRPGSLGVAVALLLGAGAVRFGAGYVRRYRGGRLSLDVQYDLRDEVFGSLQRLDGARQDRLATGQVVSRANSDVTLVQGLLAFLPNATGNLLLFVLSLAVMAVLSPLLTLVAVAVGPLLLVLALSSRSRIFPASWDAQQQAGEVAGVVEEAVTGVRVVKSFGQERRELTRLESAAGKLFASRMRNVRLIALYSPAMQAVPALGQVGVLALGGWLVLRGRISLGTFLAFSTYLGELVAPTRILAGLLTIGQQAKAAVVRVFEVIDARPALSEKPGALDLTDVHGTVEFDDVTFGYAPGRPVLEGVSLRVEPGETLALIGTSGSGTSTIALLLSRFYDVGSGAVRLDGHDVRDLTLASLRRRVGVVFEDSFLFSDTVRANIAYGRPRATEEEIRAAARIAEADEFVDALPRGYDTVVGEHGLTLSGGQRQRIALARALLTDPRVLLLDDATSAIDARVEARIFARLRGVMAGRTTLLVARRPSTLALADRVAVLDAGRVVDVGTRAELAERSPLYRRLVEAPAADAPAGTPADDSRVDGITPDLWQPEEIAPAPGGPAAAMVGAATAGGRTAAPGIGGGGGGGGGGPGGGGGGGGGPGGGGMVGALPATPELLEKVAALPPATDTPDVDRLRPTAPDRDFSLRRLLGPVRGPLSFGLLLVALDALAAIALPALVRHGVDAGIVRKASAALFATAGIALLVVVADWLVEVGQNRVTGRTGERLLYALRVKTFAHLQRLGLDYYERELAGRIMTRMTTDVDALSTFLQTGLATAVVSLLSFAGVLVAIVILDPRLALVVLAVMPVLIVATVVFRRRSREAYTESRERVSAVNAAFQEHLSGLRVAQAYGREDLDRERFRGLADAYRRSRLRAQRMIALYFPFGEFVSEVAAALVLGVGAGLVRDRTLSPGGLIAFLLYVDLLFAPIQQLSQIFDSYQQAAVGLRRLRDLLGTPTSTPAALAPVPVGRLRGEVVFDDVSFAYATPAAAPGEAETAAPEALRDVRLRIAPGETVALVGETGAGKSTLVKLLVRFYDATAGSVRIDGTDVRAYDLEGYRHRLGMVPQEAFLSAGTVRDAIAYGRPDATDAEVEAAARAVGAHAAIARLAGGYLHQVGERGRDLSAGQRQLLALARAELVDPDLLVLDEATASLDLGSEAAVATAVGRLTRRRTTVVIAHRLTTAAAADRVIVLDHGRVVEVGTHLDLVDAGGTYARLWSAFRTGTDTDALSDSASVSDSAA